MRRVVIGVMGAGERATARAVGWAEQLGALIAAEGWVLLSGGRDIGVMHAASKGAKRAGGLVVGVLPGADTAEASEHVDIAVVTGMGIARNAVNVLSSDVVVACGNAEAGTLSEIALAMKAGRPVVLLTVDDEARRFLERTGRGLLRSASSPEEVVGLVRDIVGPGTPERDLPTLRGAVVLLRPAAAADIPRLAGIRRTPEVYEHWRGGEDMVAAVGEDFAEPDSTGYVIELDGEVVGWIQWQAEEEPDYRHASMDIYVDPAVQGRGVGTDAVRTLARHLIVDHGHHRLTIDPAAHNAAAIRCYTKVGFRPVGIMRRAERGPDGTWHDGLLMDLLADELTD